MFLTAQILGIVALIFTVASFFTKKRIVFIFLNLAMNFVAGIQFICLDSWSGGFVCIFAAFRYIIYMLKEKNKFFSKIYVPILFIIANIIISIFTYEIWYDIFPAISGVSLCITAWFDNVKVLKIGSLAVCPIWFVYDILVYAWTGLLMEVVTFVVTLIIFIVSLIQEKKQNNLNLSTNNQPQTN